MSDPEMEPCENCRGTGVNVADNLCRPCEGYGEVPVEDDSAEMEAFVTAIGEAHRQDLARGVQS